MKKLFAILAVGLVMFTTAIDNAEAARRLGGGMSLGRPAPALRQAAPAPKSSAMQQNQAARQNAAQPQKNAAANAAANAAKPSMMRNLLMGAAAALGITALLSALGLSESFGQIIMIVLLAALLYFALRMVLGMFAARSAGARTGASQQSAYVQPQREPDPQPNTYSQAQSAAAAMPEAAGSRPGSVMDMFARQNGEAAQTENLSELEIPAGFDVAGFEKVAKENFVRLQQAWDSGDYNSLGDFTTDELFIELTHRLRERSGVKQTSEVINLETKLLGIANGEGEHIAVVQFKGAMKIEGEFETVDERWILTRKDDDSSGWLLAGIEQAQA